MLMASSLAKMSAFREEWWMTMAPVTPPELRHDQVLAVDSPDGTRTPPLAFEPASDTRPHTGSLREQS